MAIGPGIQRVSNQNTAASPECPRSSCAGVSGGQSPSVSQPLSGSSGCSVWDIVVYQVVVLREPPLDGEDPLTLNLLKETELQVCVHYCKTKLGNFSIISLLYCAPSNSF